MLEVKVDVCKEMLELAMNHFAIAFCKVLADMAILLLLLAKTAHLLLWRRSKLLLRLRAKLLLRLSDKLWLLTKLLWLRLGSIM